MSKGLEALKIFKELTIRDGYTTFDGVFHPAKESKVYSEAYNTIEKELKALEIIKEKPQATLWLIQVCDKKMEYEDMISIFKEDITKEQFKLLKEVLL